MKKALKIVLSAALAMLMILACAACSGGGSGSGIVGGTWNIQYDRSQFPSMTAEEASATEAYLAQMKLSITFNADGTASVNGVFSATGVSNASGGGIAKWTQSGDKITLTSDVSGSSPMVLTLRDGKLWFDSAMVGEQAAKIMYLGR